MTLTAPAKCQNCGYSSRYSRQKSGEKLRFMKCCNAWMCAGCRKIRECIGDGTTLDTSAELRPPSLQHRVPVNDGWHARIPDNVYHADRDSLSSSGARLLLPPGSPEIFRAERLDPPKPKREYDFGHAAHKMVLGEGSQLAVLDPAIHGLTQDGKVSAKPSSTTMWKKAEAAARKQGKVPITKAQMEIAQRMAGMVFQHPIASKLLADGLPEHSGYWHDDATGIRCRFRPDWVPEVGSGRPLLVDYKSAMSAEPRRFSKALFDFGYFMQAPWYIDGFEEVLGAEDTAFIFIVQSKTPPYPVSIHQIEPEHIELGRRRNRRAIELYAECMDSNTWPGFEGLHTARLSDWQVAQIEKELANA